MADIYTDGMLDYGKAASTLSNIRNRDNSPVVARDLEVVKVAVLLDIAESLSVAFANLGIALGAVADAMPEETGREVGPDGEPMGEPEREPVEEPGADSIEVGDYVRIVPLDGPVERVLSMGESEGEMWAQLDLSGMRVYVSSLVKVAPPVEEERPTDPEGFELDDETEDADAIDNDFEPPQPRKGKKSKGKKRTDLAAGA